MQFSCGKSSLPLDAMQTTCANTPGRLQEETARVEQYLLNSNFSTAIISSYTSPELSQSTFENMLEPLQKIVRLSPPIAASLAVPEIFSRTVQKLGHKDAVTRLNLLRILRTICDATDDGCTLIKLFNVHDPILHLSRHDPAILVRQMAEELVRACDSLGVGGAVTGGKRSQSRATGFRRPVSSAGARPPSSTGVRAGSGSSTGSTAVGTPPTPNSLKSNFLLPTMSPIPSSPSTPHSSSGRHREKITRSQSTAGIWDLPTQYQHHKGQHGSPKPAPLMRASTAFPAINGPGSGPGSPGIQISSSRPSSARPASRDSVTSSLLRLEASNRRESVGGGSARSKLPQSKVRRRRGEAEEENETPKTPTASAAATASEKATATPPLPRLQIARRRRDTSGSLSGARGVPGFANARRGSRVEES
jgi:hypothetical protein